MINFNTFINYFWSQGPILRPEFFHFMYNIWQDAGIRTLAAAIAASFNTKKTIYTTKNIVK